MGIREYSVDVTTCEGGGLAVRVYNPDTEDEVVYRLTGRLGEIASLWWKEACESADEKAREHSEAPCFFAFAADEVDRMDGLGQRSTSRNYRNALASFRSYLKGHDVPLPSLSPELVDGYERWLVVRGVCLNTVSNYMRILRAVFNKAVRRGLVRQTAPFDRVFTKAEETVKRAVRPEDIRKLMELQLPLGGATTLARDLFLFSFYARGMPFVDMAYLRPEQVKDGYLEYRRRKTNHRLRIKMEPCMVELIERYGREDSPYVFPILTKVDENAADLQYRSRSCYYNKLLRKLGERLELPIPLSYYVARHTWASTAYRSGVELDTISRALGHSSVKTTLIYIRRLGNDITVNRANARLLDLMLTADGKTEEEWDWGENECME